MALIRVEGKLEVGDPALHGRITQWGMSRDWRPEEAWYRRNVDWIEPLGAMAPMGLVKPVDMSSSWTVMATANYGAMRLVYPDYVYQARSWQFADGRLYTAASMPACAAQIEAGTWCQNILPRFGLWLIRAVPVDGQGIPTQVVVSLPAIWTDEYGTKEAAHLNLYLPVAGDTYDGPYQYNKPFLHLIHDADVPGTGVVDVFTMGEILDEGLGAHSMEQGVSRGGILFEYEEDATRYTGGHILIRSTSNPESWWHYHNPQLRLASKTVFDAEGITGYLYDGLWRILMAGSVQTINVSTVQYGTYDGWTMSHLAKSLPNDAALHNVTPTPWVMSGVPFGTEATVPTGWTVDVGYDPGLTFRPMVTFARSTYAAIDERPVLWYVTEQHDAVIGAEVAGRESTDDNATLIALSWTWGKDWKGSSGTATFEGNGAEQYATWRENGNVLLTLGWQSGAGTGIEATELCECYIMPGGLPRKRDGNELMGTPLLPQVELGAFDGTRLGQKTLYDMRQAGGMTVSEWASMLGNRLGIAAARVHVETAIAAKTIPLNEIPSKASLAVQDGDDASSHIAAVERSAGIRVCWDRDPLYTMWVDAGPAEYVPGTSAIALEIDAAALDAQEITEAITHTQGLERLRNVLKGIYGRDSKYSFYWAETEQERADGLGDDWAAVLVDEDAISASELLKQFEKLHYRWPSVISWTMALRVDLKPDMFVRVTNCDGIEIVAGSVYRILTHALTATAEDGTSELTAELVWTPSGGAVGVNSTAFAAAALNGTV